MQQAMETRLEPIATTPTVSSMKRKRGRPSKRDMLAVAQEGTNGVLPKARRLRKKRGEGATPTIMEDTIIGQPIHGILDGCFDAGYILTVRVGSTDTVLRGVVFGPGLSLPITKETDIAPHVKFAKREESAILPIAHYTSVPVSAYAQTVPRLSSGQTAVTPLDQLAVTPNTGTIKAFPALSVADSTVQYHVIPSQEYTHVQP